MRIIPTRVHAVLDYVLSLLLIGAPWLLGFAHSGPETWVPFILGCGGVLVSLATRYELGVIPIIPFPLHLGLDVVNGVLLIASPWLFGFAALVWAPHVILGLGDIVSAALTRTVPEATSSRAYFPSRHPSRG